MIISAAALTGSLKYDICVIGSGPAALTFASQFLKGENNLRVLLVESGETLDTAYINEHDESLSRRYSDLQTCTQALYGGRVSGWLETSKPNYLTESRLRAFGGTGNVWSGWLCAMERLDLERGKWPISYAQMQVFYKKVCAYYQIPTRWCLDEGLDDAPGWQALPLCSQAFRTRPLLARRINFGQLFKQRLISSRSVDVLLGANAVRIDTVACGTDQTRSARQLVFTSVSASRPHAIEHTVSASTFVIAAGCIESTRLLEASRPGLASGELGHYFQEHFYIWNAGTYNLTQRCVPYRPLYFQEKTLNVSENDSIVGMIVPTARYLIQSGGGTFRAILGGGPGIPGTLNLCCEQLPAQSNRIVPDHVAAGAGTTQASVHAHNELSAVDTKTIENAVMTLGETLQSSGLITHFKPAPFCVDPTQWQAPHRLAPGNHPSGTTRMSNDPNQGVVDSDCKVHGMDNLYIASTSVFPTAGYANPTLTLMALAFRLAEKLQENG